MRTREPEPLEQIDYGRDYQSRRIRKHSPSAKVIQLESLGKGGIAYLLFAGLLAVVVAMVALTFAMRSMDRAALAERETRILRDEVDRIKVAQQINTNH